MGWVIISSYYIIGVVVVLLTMQFRKDAKDKMATQMAKNMVPNSNSMWAVVILCLAWFWPAVLLSNVFRGGRK